MPALRVLAEGERISSANNKINNRRPDLESSGTEEACAVPRHEKNAKNSAEFKRCEFYRTSSIDFAHPLWRQPFKDDSLFIHHNNSCPLLASNQRIGLELKNSALLPATPLQNRMQHWKGIDLNVMSSLSVRFPLLGLR